MAFFDVRVFDPNAKRYGSKSLQEWYRKNEMKKKGRYNKRILQVENGSFTPLVFTINDGIGKESNECYSPIGEKIAEKRVEPYSVMMSSIRSKISLSMMKSIITCIRGSRLIRHEREKHNVGKS